MIRSRSRMRLAAALAGTLLLSAWVFAQPNEGCYVKVYDDENFEGRTAIWVGPGIDPSLDDSKWSGGDAVIGDDTESLITGPQAYFEGFEHPNFRGRVIRVGPNTRIRDIDATGGDEIESYRLFDARPAHWK
jgi:hypothetical protein